LPGGQSDQSVVVVMSRLGAVGAERRGWLVRGLFVSSAGVAGRSVMGNQRLPGGPGASGPSTGVAGRSGAGERGPSGKPFVISREEVARAWEKVRGSKGAPGVDAVSIAEFGRDLEGNLYKIWNRMSSGTYFPPPVKAVEIPKAGGGTRVLGVPTIADRVAQTVAAARIEAVVEPLFHDDSFGYRPRRGVADAVGRCRERCWRYDWVLDLDVSKFLDVSSHCSPC
jgi:hypothetical protein